MPFLVLWAAASSTVQPHVTQAADESKFRLATFSADVTIPLGHRCMGILPTRAQRVDDPLQVHGLVLLGDGKPIVLAAVDWCEIRNRSYDQWREALAQAAGTTRERVLVSSLHQHDAPVVDDEAQELLAAQGMKDALFDPNFHADCLARVADALKKSLADARPVTHVGIGQAKVEKVASSRRVVRDGVVEFSRYSASGADPFLSTTDDGLIDPDLKTISFWNGELPLLALHCYATHPMSHYGKGGVSYDFVGLARERRRKDDPQVQQIYASGCSGDVTAGKYNDGTPEMRPVLADRLYQAMVAAWKDTKKQPLKQIAFRVAQFDLPFHEGAEFTADALQQTLADGAAKETVRILAAMGLASRNRQDRGQKIDLPCIDFGPAQIVVLPGEAFVGYQLMAQELLPDSFVMAIGYGECWPGYVPTQAAFDDGFNHDWRWAGAGSQERIKAALEEVLTDRTP